MNSENDYSNRKVPWYGYVTLILTILILSGLFTKVDGPLAALDFSNLLGKFGAQGTAPAESGVNFGRDIKGIGGLGARDGFMLALTVGPGIILAFGIVEIYSSYKGMDAAQKVFTPILKPILGLPGNSIISLIASLTSTDAGAGIAKSLYEEGHVNIKQNIIITTFIFPAAAVLVNFYALGAALFPYISIPLIIPVGVIILMKTIGAILCRIYLEFSMKEKAVD